MTLDETLDLLEHETKKQFIARDERDARIAAVAARITGELHPGQLSRLDALVQQYKRAQQTPALARAITQLDHVRAPYHRQTPDTAYGIITARNPYVQRLEALDTHLRERTWGYDDLSRTLHHLTHDPYLRRRARTDRTFAARLAQTQLRAARELRKYRVAQRRAHLGQRAPPTRGILAHTYSTVGTRLARASMTFSGVLLALASVPMTTYC